MKANTRWLIELWQTTLDVWSSPWLMAVYSLTKAEDTFFVES